MKVVFLFSGLPHYLVKLLNNIHAAGIEVIVVIPEEKSATLGSGVFEKQEGADFKIIKLEEKRFWYGKPFFKGFSAFVKKEKPHAIVSGWPYFLVYLFNPGLLLSIKRRKITLIAREIPFTVPGFHESVEDFRARCAESQTNEKIFSNSWAYFILKMMRRLLYRFIIDKSLLYTEQGVNIIKSYGLPTDKITVTYNSPDTDSIFETINKVKASGIINANPHRLIHVGRLVKWKNTDLIINALNALKDRYPDIELTIVGKGEEEQNLRVLTKSLNLESKVHFAGALYEGEAQTIEFLKSGIYVLGGMGGLSINEAMAHGLPVICSIADGTEKQLVHEGINGAYFKDGDLQSLTDAIVKVFESEPGSMGRNSEEIIRTKINIQIVSALFIKALKSP